MNLTDLPPEILSRIIQHISFDANLTRNLVDLFRASSYLLDIARWVVKREPMQFMLTVGFPIKVVEMEARKGRGRRVVWGERGEIRAWG